MYRLFGFFFGITLIIVITLSLIKTTPVNTEMRLSDPFLQLPTHDSVRVVWFTNIPGSRHLVEYGEQFQQKAIANTTQLTHTREDQKSVTEPPYDRVIDRPVWRHEALISGLTPDVRIPYRVRSIDQGNRVDLSDTFSLVPLPPKGKPLKILLTSDHQLMPMVAANLQRVKETVGQLDAVFLAGDLVNIADRASEWFDDVRGGAFFPCLQGRANYKLTHDEVTTTYQGGEIIQHTPLYTAIGNHEIMGRISHQGLNQQFNDAIPRNVATELYQKQNNTTSEPPTNWLKANSFNSTTYEQIFTLPQTPSGNKTYYATQFGDIYLISLYVTNIWRTPNLDQAKGRYREISSDLNNPNQWGYGQHIFEPIEPESEQYQWLQQQLASSEFRAAKYRIVMFHHPPHTLGGNIVPAYTDPLAQITYDTDGTTITSVRYQYPPEQDYIVNHLLPLLESAGVNLVFYGHSHLWNRFISDNGVNYLESSNVGNSYGAHWNNSKRTIPPDALEYPQALTGNPNGLEPIVPNIAPLLDEQDQPLPYIASNEISVFSILDTGSGTISSYRFDTRQPDAAVIKFDEFDLVAQK